MVTVGIEHMVNHTKLVRNFFYWNTYWILFGDETNTVAILQDDKSRQLQAQLALVLLPVSDFLNLF
jgi:hypothetical protein